MAPEILFEDNHILVAYKPEGLAVETAKITEPDLMDYLKKYLCKKQGSDNEAYISMVHRLDQPVEGLLVFAKTPFAAKELSSQIQKNQMKKRYLAVVSIDKQLQDNSMRLLEDYLLKDGKTNTSKVVAKDTKGAKKAVLNYRFATADYQDEVAMVEIRLVTGRHHQIRVQLAHAGIPLIGDVKYGNEKSKETSAKLQVKQAALCAYQLEFFHPKTKKPLVFEIKPKKEIFKLCMNK